MSENIIAMKELPKSCDKCRYCILKYQHPFWSKEKPNTKGLDCMLLKNCDVLELHIDDETTKRKDCPIKQIDEVQNQTAIECLKKIESIFEVYENVYGDTVIPRKENGLTFLKYIDNKIKELEGEK